MTSFLKSKKTIFFLLTTFIVFYSRIVFAASSSNYIINADSVSFGGGLSSSSNFTTEDTISDYVTGDMNSSSFISSNGYIPMIFGDTTISATYPSDVTLSGVIKNTTGGQGNGEFTINVTTNSSSGYSLYLKSTTDPALTSADDSFANYSPNISGTPDFNWTVGSADGRFGFTPEGSKIVSKYKDNGTSCNAGSGDTINSCWDFISNTDKIISSSLIPNSPAGTDTVIKLRDEAGATRHIKAGAYSSTLIVTALVN